MGRHGVEDGEALRKQDGRETSQTDGTDRPDRSAPLFRCTSKVSRQVVRFVKHGLNNPAAQTPSHSPFKSISFMVDPVSTRAKSRGDNNKLRLSFKPELFARQELMQS